LYKAVQKPVSRRVFVVILLLMYHSSASNFSPQEKRLAFATGLRSVLATWPIIVLAVENNFGGTKTKDKIQRLFDEIVTYFETKKCVEQNELEDLMDDFFQTHLNMIVEDSSIPFVAKLLLQLYENIENGTLAYLNQLLKKNYQISPQDKVFGGNKLSEFTLHSEEENIIQHTQKLTITTPCALQTPSQTNRGHTTTNNSNDDRDDNGSEKENEDSWKTVKKKKRYANSYTNN
jgi:hypothetical protein